MIHRFLRLKISVLVLIGLCSLILAAPSGFAAISKSGRISDDNLTRDFAVFRKSQIEKVDYDLSFELNKASDEFKGKAVIHATLKRLESPLSVDSVFKKITSLKVNGVELTKYPIRKGSFDIPAKFLTKELVVEVAFTSDFNKEGYGFQKSVDPEDSSEYLFSDFEPYHAHHLFPCFDQPDLKATYRVSVEAPSDWNIIANALIEKTEHLANSRARTQFHQTKPFSTYLFFLGAGPFVEWTDKAGDIPLYIYARKTLAKYVDSKKIFDTSKKGLKFYADYFGYPYPFPKFGQIFIPEFAWGGMENPGAIALNESDIFRGSVTQARMENRDDLILHEMAHMWFGDLVTMGWWNDLWLNESFASYMATLSGDRAAGSKGAWKQFFSTKTWGYWQDQLVTSHPIETDVDDIRTAKGNFDGITYAKGASALQQLHFFVGEDAFRDGVRAYFKEHAFGNTTREDFISAIAKAGKQDLSAWTKAWLQSSGPNRVQANWKCTDGKVSAFSLEQSPSVSKTLSPHRARVALFKFNSSKALKLFKKSDVAYVQASTAVSEFVGVKCPDFVYPNLDDKDYALFSLDPVSLAVAKDVLSGATDDVTLRLMVWNTLSQMVRDAKLHVMEFYKMALPALEIEKDDGLLNIILGHYGEVRSNFVGHLTVPQRVEIASHLEDVALRRLAKEPKGSNLQLNFFDFYVAIAQSSEGISRLKGYLDGIGIPDGMQLDQDRRWNIVKNLSRDGFADFQKLIDTEVKRDPSTEGVRSAYSAKVAAPTSANKANAWAEFQKKGKIPRSTMLEAAGFFHNYNNIELSKPFVAPYFKVLTHMDWKSNDDLIEVYFQQLFPYFICSADLLSQSERTLAQAKNLTPLARRAWLEANDDLSKCIAARKL